MPDLEVPTWSYRGGETIPQNSLNLFIVADYGHSGDLAFGEVIANLQNFDRNSVIKNTTLLPAHAFSTIETGFMIGQILN